MTKMSENSCWPTKREALDLGFTLGYLQATVDHKMQSPPTSGHPLLSGIKEGLHLLGLLYKAWPLLSWTTTLGCFGWFAKMLSRFFAG
jgi:hypothetical protein